MIIIGVTGGIGAGKSSVSAILKELGAIVLDADAITKEVQEPHQTAWVEIVSAFGPEVLRPDETLDRKKLASIVFGSETEKKRLEAIIHEKVLREMKNRLDDLREKDYRGVVVLDVPIPVKNGFLDTVDAVWVVTCSEEERVRRVMIRSGLTEAEARMRMASQLSQEAYMELSDVVIINDKTPEALYTEVKRLYRDVMQSHR